MNFENIKNEMDSNKLNYNSFDAVILVEKMEVKRKLIF